MSDFLGFIKVSKITLDGKEVDLTGVVTEKQLADLIKQLKEGKGGSGGLDKFTASTKASSGFLNAMGQAAKSTGGAVLELAGSVYQGTASLSGSLGSLSKVMPGVLDNLTDGAKAIVAEGEQYVGVFRELSKTGGGLNGDLFELKNSAAQSRMTLDQFASVVQKNSSTLGAMGGTVSSGTRLFTQFSKELFDGTNGMGGLVQTMTNMGMTTKDINESMLLMGEIQQRSNFEDAKVRQEAAISATKLSQEMDAMAKLTGKSKEALKEEMMASQRKGQVEAKFRLIEQQQGKEAAAAARAQYTQAMLSAKQFGPGAVAALEETFVLGAARSKQAREGMVAMGPAAEAATATFRAIADHPLTNNIDEMMSNVNAGFMKRINDPNFLNMTLLAGADNPFGQAGASMLESGGKLQSAVEKFMGAGDDFKTAYEKAKKQIAAEQEGKTAPGAAKTPGAEVGQALMTAEVKLKDLSAVVNNELLGEKGAINGFAKQLKELNTFMQTGMTRESMEKAIAPALRAAASTVGGTGNAPEGPQGPRVTTAEAQAQSETIAATMKTIVDTTELTKEQAATMKTILAGMLSDVEAAKLSENLNKGAEQAGMTLGEYLKKIVMEADQAKAKEAAMAASGRDSQAINRRVAAMPEDPRSAVESLNQVNTNAEPIRRQGGSLEATGSLLENFGKGTAATLHGNEGVITAKQLENMAAGVSSMMKNNVQSAPQPNFSGLENSMKEMMMGMQGEMQKIAQNPAIQESMKGLTDMISTKMDENKDALGQLHSVARKQVGAIKSQGFDVFARNVLG